MSAIFRTIACALGMNLLLAGGIALAQQAHQHGNTMKMDAPSLVFIASTGKSFAALMEDAMAVMDDGMRRAPMSGQQEHDFVSMMIPHHQGAVDMAKALLLRTTDPAMRNLAQGILAEQQIEIQLMQQWLKDHPQPARSAVVAAQNPSSRLLSPPPTLKAKP